MNNRCEQPAAAGGLVPQNRPQHVLWLARPEIPPATDPFDEEQHSGTLPAADPETLLLQTDHARLIELAMSGLPDRVRRILVLRELEGLSTARWPTSWVFRSAP